MMNMTPPDAVLQAAPLDMDDGGKGAPGAAVELAPAEGLAPMDQAADAVTVAIDAAQSQSGDSAPADAATMDQAAARTADVPEVDEALEATLHRTS